MVTLGDERSVLHVLQVIAVPSELDALRGSGGESVTMLEMAPDAAWRLRDAHTTRGMDSLEGLAAPLRHAGLLVTTALREGVADEQIVAYAQEQGIDLIVMSTHGHRGVTRFFLGSVTDRVIRAGTDAGAGGARLVSVVAVLRRARERGGRGFCPTPRKEG